MVFCSKCGTQNPNTSEYCQRCGASLHPTPQPRPIASLPKQRESIGFVSKPTADNLVLQCSLCGGRDFARDTGRMDSKWGMTSFKMVILTCKRCGHIELFNKGRTIFDFD